MRRPLTHWRLHGESLPDELLDDARETGFSLPGAAALGAFADLLGDAPDEAAAQEAIQKDKQDDAQDSAPFSLPAPIPEGASGCVTLTREIDFGTLAGDCAALKIDHIQGSGEILLDDAVLARFGGARHAHAAVPTAEPCMLAADLTDALHLGRRRTLALRFDAARPAGVFGPVMLHVAAQARLLQAQIAPDARRRTMTVRVTVEAFAAGPYVLRALPVAPALEAASAAPAQEIALSMEAGAQREEAITLPLAAETFRPGAPYAPGAVKLQLFLRREVDAGEGMLCDDALLLCGYPSAREAAYLPLDEKDISGDPQALAAQLAALGVPCAALPASAPDSLLRALCRAGVGARMHGDGALRAALSRYPNVIFAPAAPERPARSPEAAAWQLGGMVAYPRAVDPDLSDDELLHEAAGRPIHRRGEHARDVLAWLGAVALRLRAEAARQGRYAGPLCAAGALHHNDARDALRTAFAPLHLSALPLCGAWWTGARFSASIEAFLPADERRALGAIAILEDEDGRELARVSARDARCGFVGVLEATLPDHPCVLTLTCALVEGGEAVEESILPVYVGERGPLEAAF